MIPQNFKDVLANVQNAGLMQTIAMILFILFFLSLIYVVMSRPKKYYHDAENAPLENDSDDFKL